VNHDKISLGDQALDCPALIGLRSARKRNDPLDSVNFLPGRCSPGTSP
jgi:hypothetical protein